MRITPEQYEEIREIVRIHHEVVVAAFCGEAALPEQVRTRIVQAHVPTWTGSPIVDDMVRLGTIMAAMPDPGPHQEQDVSLAEFAARVEHRRTIPLSRPEAYAVARAQARAARYCRGLANRIAEGTEDVIVQAAEEDRAAAGAAIQTEVAEGIRWRETTGQIKTRIGRATGDWTRDLGRIAATEVNNAIQDGKGAAIAEEHGDDALVCKRPNPSACPACLEFYLDRLGNPRIYRLSELAGQTNARDPASPHKARRRKSWVPTLESLHPWCHCTTLHVPTGWGFNEHSQLVPPTLLSGVHLEVAQAAVSPRADTEDAE